MRFLAGIVMAAGLFIGACNGVTGEAEEGCPGLGDPPYTGQQVYECRVGSMVEVQAVGWAIENGEAVDVQWVGSGVLIDDAGWVATNFHVVRRALAAQVKVSATGAIFGVSRLLYRDAARDLAIIELDAQNVDFTHVPIGELSALRVGQHVFSISNAAGGGPEYQSGEINALREVQLDGRFSTVIQHSAVIEHGSSGGGVFDDAAFLVGVSFAKNAEREQVAYAAPATYLEMSQGRVFRVLAALEEYFEPSVENMKKHLVGIGDAGFHLAGFGDDAATILLQEDVDYVVGARGQSDVAVAVGLLVPDGTYVSIELIAMTASDTSGVAEVAFTAPVSGEYAVIVKSGSASPQDVDVVAKMVDW